MQMNMVRPGCGGSYRSTADRSSAPDGDQRSSCAVGRIGDRHEYVMGMLSEERPRWNRRGSTLPAAPSFPGFDNFCLRRTLHWCAPYSAIVGNARHPGKSTMGMQVGLKDCERPRSRRQRADLSGAFPMRCCYSRPEPTSAHERMGSRVPAAARRVVRTCSNTAMVARDTVAGSNRSSGA